MCGIVGAWGFDHARMDAALRLIFHRGPDDLGVLHDGDLCLGMRRLSIIDVAGSNQPIFNEDGSVGIVFNGELYNYHELQRSLVAKGHTLRTAGDTEMIVHLYEEYGPACVHLLRGMFAFAIWDRTRQTLFLARDRLGIKPLYYHWDGQRLAFASEIKALRVWEGVGRRIDTVALEHYLAYRYVPGPRTMYQGILKLQPGHTLLLHDGALRIDQYWAPVVESAYAELTEQDAAHELYRLLDEAVSQHMVADVPLGALLSSGIDSASVVALMSQHSMRPVQTFTVGFGFGQAQDGTSYDETQGARAVAAYFGADHHEVRVGAAAADLLPKLMWHFDEPVADPAALPTFLISRFARRSVTVALSGEGADELLGGYPRYYWATRAQRLQEVLPTGLATALTRGLEGVIRAPERRRRLRLLLGPATAAQRHVAWTGGLAAAGAALLPDCAGEPPPQHAYLGTGKKLHDPMRTDMATWLVDDVLMKADKMSMAASLELRVPFLDHRLVEFVTSLPEAFKRPMPTTKPLLRRAMRPLLPAAVLQTRKNAFRVPIAEWLRGELRGMVQERVLDVNAAGDHGLFDRVAVRGLWQEHQTQRQDHALGLWSLLCFEVWYDAVFRRPEHQELDGPLWQEAL